MVNAITDAMFDKTVLQADRPVLVDFWAPWCGPCKMLAPVLDAYAAAAGTRLSVVKIDVDTNREVAGRLGLRAVPTLVLFRGGRAIGQKSGAMNGEQLAQWVEQTLEATPAG